ncbi:MAG: ATP-binding protein [Verrucomicrobiae bacterium]
MLLGPRQCGKTTLAREIYEAGGGHFFDLEDPEIGAAFASPKLVLEPLDGLIIIDEAQWKPEIFPVLRGLADADRRAGRSRKFLLLGSASPALGLGASESLAGRVHQILMQGFTLEETGLDQVARLWGRGGFPDAFLACDDATSFMWRRDFIETFLLRDLPQMGVSVPPAELRRLWMMISHLHGQLLNLSDLGRSLSVNHSTVRRHLDILDQAYVVRILQPWHENLSKRQRKSPKLYVRDSGLLHALLGVRDEAALRLHPKAGASWEGFAIEQVLGALRPEESFFWQTQGGAELDLLTFSGGRRLGFECKLSDRPTSTKSMYVAAGDLQLDHLYVVHPGSHTFPLADKITAIPLPEIVERANLGSL